MSPESPQQAPVDPSAPQPCAMARGLAFVLRKASKWCFGFDLVERAGANKRRHEANARRIDALEKLTGSVANRLDLVIGALEAASSNPHALWLFANRQERMDATVPYFDASRRAFHLERYTFASGYTAGKSVADIACGPGYGSGLLRSSGRAERVIGIDIDPHAVAYAVYAHGASGAQFVCASGTATPLPDACVDVVVSFETIEHLPDDVALLGEFTRILKPGGRLICSTPNQWPLDKAPYHVREYDRASFEAVLRRFFEIDALYNQNSGGDWLFNRKQPAGIVPTTPENEQTAECYIAVCTKR